MSRLVQNVDNRYKFRGPSVSDEPSVFGDIYKEEINIAIWQRSLDSLLTNSAIKFIEDNPTFHTAMTVSLDKVAASLDEEIGSSDYAILTADISELVDMFCYLFELKKVGLRLKVLDRAMCPKFHVDRVPCRLLTSYSGKGTEWLPNHLVDRSKLGTGSNGKPDSESGLYHKSEEINQLTTGDVALLKGENWFDNEFGGLVHRSPSLSDGEKRLIISLDFAD